LGKLLLPGLRRLGVVLRRLLQRRKERRSRMGKRAYLEGVFIFCFRAVLVRIPYLLTCLLYFSSFPQLDERLLRGELFRNLPELDTFQGDLYL